MYANVIEWCSIENGITDAVSEIVLFIFCLLFLLLFYVLFYVLFQLVMFFLTRTEKRKSVIKYFWKRTRLLKIQGRTLPEVVYPKM